MLETELAYVAGIIDGEGSIGIYQQKARGYRSKVMRVTVDNTDEWLIRQLLMWFGGHINRRSDHRGNRKDVWQWYVESKKAGNFLRLILPYVRMKRPQVELALQFQERKHPCRGHTEEELALEEAERLLMHKMNRTGKL